MMTSKMPTSLRDSIESYLMANGYDINEMSLESIVGLTFSFLRQGNMNEFLLLCHWMILKDVKPERIREMIKQI